eukprot:gnl/MRDRNA2_/MRDRNA2_19543_c0_seq1.p1 gnl/MRDRNA2_/MRDRNA2_19543_c0~~gnl/MRDRNA2_/MRDRNA2_19543_c0_seq1.p1  ORF type:complete len:949 (+),score=147.50 gnl/MRDRNA2_/MRDRNA2_19543_c0_seq1:147-2849(+)
MSDNSGFQSEHTTGHCHQQQDKKPAKLHTCFTGEGFLGDTFGKNRIATWVPCAVGEETLQISDEDVVRNHGVPQRLLVQYVRTEIKNEEMFLTMPLAIILVIVYSVSLAYHDGATTVRDIEDAITFDLRENANFAFSAPGAMGHKGIDDAHSIADIHSWLRLGLRPLLFKEDYGWSEDFGNEDKDWTSRPIAHKDRTTYLQYNQIIGGLVLEQVRAPIEECKQPDVADSLKMVCYPAEKATGMTNLHLKPNHFEASQAKPQYDPRLKRWLLTQESAASLDHQLKQLEASGWIDNSTAQVSVKFLTYNAHFDTLTATGIHFHFARSGHIWKTITHTSTFLQLFQTKRVIASDICFLLIIAWLLVSEIKEAGRHISMGYILGAKPWEALQEYIDIWNAVDWLAIGIAIALSIICVLYGQSIGILREELLEVGEIATAINPEWSFEAFFQWSRLVYSPILETLMEEFNKVHILYGQLKFIASLYPVVLVLRLFKAFQAQPRLSIVTRTLMHCGTDVAHFTVVFGAVFCCLAIMGMSLFGREIDDFSTFPRALTQCFVILMGDFDVEAMWEVGRPMATLWFAVFMVFVLLIMLNMLLAIIMDAYSEVKANVQSSDTLCFHIATFWRRWRELRTGERVSLHHVYRQLMSVWTHRNLEALETQGLEVHWEHNEIMTVEVFRRHVNGLSEVQALRLMENSVRAWRMTNESALTLSEVLSSTANMIVGMNRTFTMHTDRLSASMEEMNTKMSASWSELPNPDFNATSQDLKSEGTDDVRDKNLKVPQASRLCSPSAPNKPPPQDICTRLDSMEARFARLEASVDRLVSIMESTQTRISPRMPNGAVYLDEKLEDRGNCSSRRANQQSDPAGLRVQEIPIDSHASSSMLSRTCCGQDLRQGSAVNIAVE